ncbi:MAG: hypothetical protein A2086_02630 [Spirochaetes bacterium GWD1_27_9]|nr:MAG: hypothetical protein A2Z98_05325 [Spirochaetes bacterium GWB1_27_13]OHD27276.1 MAG: hypothetical protein A2Y34_10005 [Spirochaetes bacterium GWC1_27_15]OHD33503.1 MAG: hypothetical protein A2086_02630 [Spirochaetes bacterium GWD1_27_9]
MSKIRFLAIFLVFSIYFVNSAEVKVKDLVNESGSLFNPYIEWHLIGTDGKDYGYYEHTSQVTSRTSNYTVVTHYINDKTKSPFNGKLKDTKPVYEMSRSYGGYKLGKGTSIATGIISGLTLAGIPLLIVGATNPQIGYIGFTDPFFLKNGYNLMASPLFMSGAILSVFGGIGLCAFITFFAICMFSYKTFKTLKNKIIKQLNEGIADSSDQQDDKANDNRNNIDNKNKSNVEFEDLSMFFDNKSVGLTVSFRF